MPYVQAFMSQTAQTALTNGRAKLEERLARWILMAHDRTDGDTLDLTHEFLALMLGVRRPGVTIAMHFLEGAGLIRSTRRAILIVDRDGLEQHADGSYGVPEAEYERLLGVPLKKAAQPG
jgi:CRP-like cAMP-binding protein